MNKAPMTRIAILTWCVLIIVFGSSIRGQEKARRDIPKATDPKSAIEAENEFLADFVGRFLFDIEQLNRLDTTAKRDAEHRNIVKKFDDELKSKKLKFDFPIENVKQSSNSTILVTVGTPDQLKDIHFTSVIKGFSQAIPAKDALQIGKQHVLVATGVGRIVASTGFVMPPETARAKLIFAFKTFDNQGKYALYLDSIKTKIVAPVAPKEDE